MRRTVPFLFMVALGIATSACGLQDHPAPAGLRVDHPGGGDGGKATPTSTPPAATATTVAAQPIPTVIGEATVTASGLQIIDTQAGTGAEAKLGDTITVQYTGYFDDGTIFDGPAIHGDPVQFQLAVGGLIRGWTDGVPGMKVGGTRRLIIPPELAYGAAGRRGIPPNARLTFDIELVSIP